MLKSAVERESASCRSCGSRDLMEVLSLGDLPLANAYRSEGDDSEERRYPLDVVWCGACCLAQLRDAVPPEEMFRDYLYQSSYSETMLRHARRLAEGLIASRALGRGSFVVEAASNDGYLLRPFAEAGVPVLGIEPASNVAEVARRDRGIDTLTEFFGRELAAHLRDQGKQADVFLGLNVLAHVPDLNGFVEAIRILLKKDGIAVIEVPYLRDLIDRVEFDTIYHEHVFYFTVHSLVPLARRHGLRIERIEQIRIHGGSLRVHLSPGSDMGSGVSDLLASEASAGIDSAYYYRDFSDRVQASRESLRQLLSRLKREGARIAAYGAAAKGTILLNTCGIGTDIIDFVCDRSPVKQGRRMPGVGIPIVGSDALVQRRPDYVLLLAWNLADEIREQQREFLERGGRFIHPVPTARVL